jgi:hypothetical protein
MVRAEHMRTPVMMGHKVRTPKVAIARQRWRFLPSMCSTSAVSSLARAGSTFANCLDVRGGRRERGNKG